jgi:hypothetical protein
MTKEQAESYKAVLKYPGTCTVRSVLPEYVIAES